MSMTNDKIFVDLDEAGHIILNMIGSSEFENVLKNSSNQTEDFKQGALFGAVIGFSFVNSHASKYVLKEKTNVKKELSRIIKLWKDEAGVKGIVQISAYSGSGDTLTICTDRPGYMIGLHGFLVAKYKESIQEICPNIKNISFIETDSWYIK